MPEERGIVLVLEDDAGIRRLQRSYLERAGYEVRLAQNIREAREQLASGDIDLLLLDYHLGDSETGLEFYRDLHAAGSDIPAVLVTGFGDETRLLEAMRAGVRDFIPKTPSFVDLVPPTVDRVMAQVRQERRLVAAEAESRAKDNFLATLSHELRTPLTPVAALVSALREDTRLPEDVRSDIEVIHRNITLESRLIDDLLDLTRIARGKLELRMEVADLRSIIEHALTTVCESEASTKGVRCHGSLAVGAHFVHGDPARLTQVFWNLLRNSVKFTPEGGSVSVSSRIKDHAVIVDVKDTGIGIDAETLPRIFGAFEQGDRAITRRFGGLGLGLAISKAIVELHGGRISASSGGRGKGATFSVELPLTEAIPPSGLMLLPASDASTPIAIEPEAAHLLLVEDHADTATVLARMLRRAGYRVTLASSVAEAVASAKAAQVEIDGTGRVRPIDLVVSDLGLPDGSGADVMKTLRAHHQLRGIALSGFGMDEDVRRAIEAGFSRHITKPVDMAQLLGTIQEVLQTSG